MKNLLKNWKMNRIEISKEKNNNNKFSFASLLNIDLMDVINIICIILLAVNIYTNYKKREEINHLIHVIKYKNTMIEKIIEIKLDK